MLALLLKKEWRLNFRSKGNTKESLASKIMNVFIVGMLLAVFIFIFVLLNKRFKTYGVTRPLYIIFMFIVMILQMALHLPKFKKIVFNPDDKQIIDCLPIKRRTLIISKLIVFYIEEVFSLLFLVLSLTISYGIINEVSNKFYLILVPLLTVLPLVVVTLSLIFVLPYYILVEKIKSKYLVQFLLIVLLIATFALLYKNILEVFISLVNEDRLTYIFNIENANMLERISSKLIPCNLIMNLLDRSVKSFIYLFLMCVVCLVICYIMSDRLYFLNLSFKENKTKEKKNYVTNDFKALVKKEYILMFRSTNYLFSYGSLLVLLPVFVTIISMTFSSLITRLLGDLFFVPFVVLFVTMFSAVINSFGGLFISREKQSISIIKMLPVSFKKQMNIKVGIAIFNAMVSILFTVISLTIFGLVSFFEGIAIFVIASLLVSVMLVTLAKKDLKNPAYENEENNLGSAIVFSLILPILLFLGSLFLMLQFGESLMFLILILVMLVIFVALFVSYSSTIDESFKKLRVE